MPTPKRPYTLLIPEPLASTIREAINLKAAIDSGQKSREFLTMLMGMYAGIGSRIVEETAEQLDKEPPP